MRFRDAEPADAPELAVLVHSAYRGDSSRQGWTTEADLLEGNRIDADGVRAIIDDPQSIVLVATDDASDPEGRTGASILACCQLERRDERIAYFGMFAVRPGRQGGGTGRIVLAEAERTARARWGITTMEMTVIVQREELIAWYERRGYVRTDETHPFPYGDERFGLPQREDLHFVVLRKDLSDTDTGLK